MIEMIDVRPLFRRHLLSIEPVPATGSVVEQGEVAVGVASHHRFGQCFKQASIHFLLLVQLQLLGLALGDIRHQPVPKHRTVRLTHGRRAGFHPDQALARVVDPVFEVPRREGRGGMSDARQHMLAVVRVHAGVDRSDAGLHLGSAQAVDVLNARTEVRERAVAVGSPAELEQHAGHLRRDLLQAQLQVFLVGQVIGADDVAAQQLALIVDRRDIQEHRNAAAVAMLQTPLAHFASAFEQRCGEHGESRLDGFAKLIAENGCAALQRFLRKQC